MTRILLSGCCGKMGRFVAAAVAQRKDCEIVAGIDIVDDSTLGFPVFANYDEVEVKADVIIDFSNPSLLPAMLSYAVKTNTGVVLATTGLTDEQIKAVEDASETVPVFFFNRVTQHYCRSAWCIEFLVVVCFHNFNVKSVT